MKTTDKIIKHASAKQVIGALNAENKKLKSIKDSLEIALAEQERIVSKLIDELLILRGVCC